MERYYGCSKFLPLEEGCYYVNVPVPRQGRIEARPLPMCGACNLFWRALQTQEERQARWKKGVTIAVLVVLLCVSMCSTWR